MSTTQRPRARPAAAAVLAGLLTMSLAACGGTEGGGGGPTDGSSPRPTESSSSTGEAGPVEHRLLKVISTTLGGGTVQEQAVDLTAPGGVDELVAGLESGLPEQVRREVRRLRALPATRTGLEAGARLYGAVAWVGCETPRDIAVVRRHGGLEVKALVPGKGTTQCLAPVTSVVIFSA